MDMYTLLYLEWITNKDHTWNSAQGYVAAWMGGDFGREFSSVQFNSVAQPFSTLYDSMDCSMPGFPVHRQLPELAQTHVHQVADVIQPSHPSVICFSSCLQSFPASGSFQMSQFFASGCQSIGITASASVLPMNIQD